MNYKKITQISILKTLFFNFHYLNFKQAIKLPILVSRHTKIVMGGVV